MLKKSITYENPFTGMQTTEEFHFHISKADLVTMEVEEHQEKYTGKDGVDYTGMQAKLQRIVDSEDGKAMMPVFKDIVRRSYGRRDGDRFMRSDEIWADFEGSGAFDALLFELCTDAGAAAEFVNGAMPANLESLTKEIQAQAAAKKAAAKKPVPKKKPDEKPEDRAKVIAAATSDSPVVLTQEEMVNMESSDLQTGLVSGKFKLA